MKVIYNYIISRRLNHIYDERFNNELLSAITHIRTEDAFGETLSTYLSLLPQCCLPTRDNSFTRIKKPSE